MSVTPSALDVQSSFVRSVLSNLHTCMPGEVIRVHDGVQHKLQFVDVQPSLQRVAFNEDGELVNETLPVLPMVPVAHLKAGGFFIALPVTVGDIVTLLFAERSLDQWIEVAKRGTKQAITPGDESAHSFEGAIALPCAPASRPELLQDVSATDLVIGGPGGIALRVATGGLVRVAEGGGEDFVALQQKTRDELDRLWEAVQTHTHMVSTEGTASAQAGTAAAAGGESSANSVAATKLKTR